jgi:hypothetical protein
MGPRAINAALPLPRLSPLNRSIPFSLCLFSNFLISLSFSFLSLFLPSLCCVFEMFFFDKYFIQSMLKSYLENLYFLQSV